DDPAYRRQNLFHGRFTRYAWLSHINPRFPLSSTQPRIPSDARGTSHLFNLHITAAAAENNRRADSLQQA
ncbi:MAG: hypothetical protein J0G97_23595, partial [Rhizobium pusense]|nr:hypothetical protein [Agrobacterium pusense]